jgi:DTW domain-containing protein
MLKGRKMRSSSPRSPETHCFRCYQRKEICICAILPTVFTKTEFLILRHICEAERPSNTGRLAALILPHARIIPCGGKSPTKKQNLDDEALQLPGTWLLWPDGPGAGMDFAVAFPPSRIAVIDATWHQARRLYQKAPILRALPQLALPAPAKARDRLRKQRRTDGMSTLEAIAAAIKGLEGAEVAEPLEKLYDELVRRTRALRWGKSDAAPNFPFDSSQRIL